MHNPNATESSLLPPCAFVSSALFIEEAYIEGFRTGARIMLAVLEEDELAESEDEKE